MNFDYINEAFKKLNVLEEDMFKASIDGVNSLTDFTQNDDEEVVNIIDPEAQSEDELNDSYIGKVIVNCNVCHSHIFKDKDNIVIDEDGAVNTEDVCPYCGESEGFIIVGEITPFKKEKDTESLDEGVFNFKEKREEKYESLINRVFKKSGAAIRNELKEPLTSLLKTSLKNIYMNDKDEDKFETNKLLKKFNAWMTQEDTSLKLFKEIKFLVEENSQEDRYNELLDTILKGAKRLATADPKIGPKAQAYFCSSLNDVLKFCLKQAVREFKSDNPYGIKESTISRSSSRVLSLEEDVNNVNVETDNSIINVHADEDGKVTVVTEPVQVDTDAETIAPISDDTTDEILSNNDIDTEEPVEEEEETLDDADINNTEDSIVEESLEHDVEFDEVDEDSLNHLAESYLKTVYENIQSFKTTNISCTPLKMIVEGVIKFNSGTEKKTGFIFEAKDINSRGQVRFIGSNKHLTESADAFTLVASVDNNKLFTESLKYQYSVNDQPVRGVARRK